MFQNQNFRPFKGAIIAGDSGYFEKTDWLSTPHPDFETINNEKKKRYNIAFCRARIIVEQSIGILKHRWKVLMHPMRFKDIELCAKMVIVASCLHNFCVDHQDHWKKNKKLRDTDNQPEDQHDSSLEGDDNDESEDGSQSDKSPDSVANRIFLTEKYF